MKLFFSKSKTIKCPRFSHVALEVENVKKFYFLHLQYFLFIKECNQENVPYVKQVHQKSITYKFGFKLDETLRLRSPASI